MLRSSRGQSNAICEAWLTQASNAPFRGQTVLLVGCSNSAGDVATEVAAVADSVLISRRRGAIIVQRMTGYRPSDLVLTHRLDAITWFISSFAPSYFAVKIAEVIKNRINAGWGDRIKPEWDVKTEDAASICFQAPMVTDTVVPLIEAGKVGFVPGIRRVQDDGKVELQDGRVVHADAIIYCTGYDIDPVLSRCVDRVGDLKLARLYHNIYHPDYPDSLAYLTFWHTIAGKASPTKSIVFNALISLIAQVLVRWEISRLWASHRSSPVYISSQAAAQWRSASATIIHS